MKKVLLSVVILLFCAVCCIALLACSEQEPPTPIYLREGMTVSELLDVLNAAYSFTLRISDEDYRFVRGRGYTKYEEGVFDGLVCEDGYVYRMSDANGVLVTKEPLTPAFYDEVDEIYFSYVKRLQDSLDDIPSKTVEFKDGFGGNSAIIKIIRKDDEGSFTVIVCEIKDVNTTELMFTEEFKEFKTLAENA